MEEARVLAVVDDHPATIAELARSLTAEPEEVERALEALEARGRVVCWGELWASTWRAKLALHPTFFRRWLPGSLAVGGGVTALGVVLNGPGGADHWVPILVVLAGVAAGLALVARERTEEGEGGDAVPPPP